MEKHLEFFEKYHRGAVNVLLHDFGFALWGLGVGIHSWTLIILSPLVWESGHFYNYIKGIHRTHAKQTIFPQFITWITFLFLGYVLVAFFHM